MASDRRPSPRAALCVVMLPVLALAGCARFTEPVKIGPTKSIYETTSADASANCYYGGQIDDFELSTERCKVYLTRSKSRAITKPVHDHPDTADMVQQALSTAGAAACTVIMKSRAGKACGPLLAIQMDMT